MITVRVGGASIAGYGVPRGLYKARAGQCEMEFGSARIQPALPPKACKLATGLKEPISDGRKPRLPRLAAVEAHRGFSAGSFYLPGQIIDRSI